MAWNENYLLLLTCLWLNWDTTEHLWVKLQAPPALAPSCGSSVSLFRAEEAAKPRGTSSNSRRARRKENNVCIPPPTTSHWPRQVMWASTRTGKCPSLRIFPYNLEEVVATGKSQGNRKKQRTGAKIPPAAASSLTFYRQRNEDTERLNDLPRSRNSIQIRLTSEFTLRCFIPQALNIYSLWIVSFQIKEFTNCRLKIPFANSRQKFHFALLPPASLYQPKFVTWAEAWR